MLGVRRGRKPWTRQPVWLSTKLSCHLVKSDGQYCVKLRASFVLYVYTMKLELWEGNKTTPTFGASLLVYIILSVQTCYPVFYTFTEDALLIIYRARTKIVWIINCIIFFNISMMQTFEAKGRVMIFSQYSEKYWKNSKIKCQKMSTFILNRGINLHLFCFFSQLSKEYTDP